METGKKMEIFQCQHLSAEDVPFTELFLTDTR